MAFYAARMWAKDKADGAEPKRGAPVLLFSLEMAASQLSARILSEQTEIEMRKIRTGRFTEREWEPFRSDSAGARRLAALHRRHRRHLDRADRCALAAHEAREEHRHDHDRLSAAGRTGTRRFENRVQEISEVTKGLKTLAKELAVPVDRAFAAFARRRQPRRQAPRAVGLARIRFDRTGRRRRDVRLSRRVLSKVARTGR